MGIGGEWGGTLLPRRSRFGHEESLEEEEVGPLVAASWIDARARGT